MRQNKSHVVQILDILSSSKALLNLNNILVTMEDRDHDISENVLTTTLSKMKRDNLVSYERHYCICCGHRVAYYKVTEQGRIVNNRYKPLLETIGQFTNLVEINY